MLKIAHRGNFEGRNAERENTMDYLRIAIRAGYDVEVDVRYDGIGFWLGHDKPTERVDIEFLTWHEVWTHAKTIETLRVLWPHPEINVFWHDKDDFTYTSKGIKWANTGIITHDGIMVMPENNRNICGLIKEKLICPLGICSDNFSLFV